MYLTLYNYVLLGVQTHPSHILIKWQLLNEKLLLIAIQGQMMHRLLFATEKACATLSLIKIYCLYKI